MEPNKLLLIVILGSLFVFVARKELKFIVPLIVLYSNKLYAFFLLKNESDKLVYLLKKEFASLKTHFKFILKIYKILEKNRGLITEMRMKKEKSDLLNRIDKFEGLIKKYQDLVDKQTRGIQNETVLTNINLIRSEIDTFFSKIELLKTNTQKL